MDTNDTKMKQAHLQSDHRCHCNLKPKDCKFPDCNADRTPKHIMQTVVSLLPPLAKHLMAH